MGYDRYKIYNGKSIAEWSRETEIKAGTLQYRLSKGMSIEEAISKPIATPHEAAKKHDVVGKTFINTQGEKFVVTGIAFRDKYSVAHYDILFPRTGYRTTSTVGIIIGTSHGSVQDRLSPSVHGVGIMGNAYGKDNPKLFDVWRAMIARCYNQKNPSYKTYGAKGVKVCDRWLRFDYFLEDVVKLPGFNQEDINSGKLVMDKDTIDRSKMIYSPETCCFITRAENTKESATRRKAK